MFTSSIHSSLLSSFLLMKILAALISLWTIFILWRAFNALSTLNATPQISISGTNSPLFRKFSTLYYKSPASANSMIMHRHSFSSSINASLYAITLLCLCINFITLLTSYLIEASIRTSFREFSFSFSLSLLNLTYHRDIIPHLYLLFSKHILCCLQDASLGIHQNKNQYLQS